MTSDPDGTDTGVTVRRLPAPDSLPDEPLLLDATARPELVAGLFDVSVDDMTVFGDDPPHYDGLEVTQVIDGQYHPGTLKRSETARERVAKTLCNWGAHTVTCLSSARNASTRCLSRHFPTAPSSCRTTPRAG